MIRKCFIMFNVGICAAVMLLWLFRINPQTALSGVTLANEKPQWTLRGGMNGEFQSGFDSWFGENFPLRSYFVKGYDQLLFSSGSAVNTVWPGKSGDLHGTLWMDGYLIYQIDDMTMERYRNDLNIIKDYALDNGIRFFYIISPNKAEIYSETLPWNYQIIKKTSTNLAAARKQIIGMLDEMNIDYLDTTELMLKIRETEGIEPFSKTGIHWNSLGAVYALQEFIQCLNGTKKEIPEIIPEFTMSREPEPSDTDYKDLCNVYWSNFDSEYPHVKFELDLETGTPDKRVYAMTTSYHNAFMELFKENDMPFKSYKRLYYNQLWSELQRTDYGVEGELWNPGIPLDQVNYQEALECDILVIEHNAGELPQAHIEFVSKLADYMQGL